MKKLNFTIVGSGAYGTCLANVLSDNGYDVVIYGIDEKQIDDINIYHQNSFFFGDLKLNKNIKATTQLSAALNETDVLILAVPTLALKVVIPKICETTDRNFIVINTAKGMNEEDNNLLSNFIKNQFHKSNLMKDYAVIYGPSIASEVAKRLPTAVTLACEKKEVAEILKPYFLNEYFALEISTDVVGCELVAALKNAIAIGSGILDGLQAGDNARSSLITLGMQEIYKISKVFGGKQETFMSYAAIGDLILTATSPKSRNYRLGYDIGTNNNPKKTLSDSKNTTEGVGVIKIAYDICQKYQIQSNIFSNLYEILYNFKHPVYLANNFLNSI